MSASTEKKVRREARAAGTDKKTLAAQEAAKKQAKTKRTTTITVVAVVVAIALIILLGSGFLYSHSTAISVGSEKFTPAECNYFYAEQYYNFVNQYGSYASLFGLDTSSGMSELANQTCGMLSDGGTWKDYFRSSMVSQVEQLANLNAYAKANGITLTEDEITNINDQVAAAGTAATSYGYSSLDKFFSAYYGKGVTAKVVTECLKYEQLASKAYNSVSDTKVYTDAELEEAYASLNGSSDLFDYNYYYVKAETVTTGEGDAATTAATAETMAAAKADAEAILAAYNSGKGLDDLDKLNNAVSSVVADAAATERTNTAGASLASAYSEWLMDSARKAGDATIAENPDQGWFVVVFEGRNDNHYATVDVRHILVMAEADADGVYTDEAKAAAEAKANEILAQWQAGEATEDSFAALANELSEDGGSNTVGGLYTQIYRGEMVENFEAFCFDEGSKPGDTAVIYGESSGYAGYHVMYFVGENDLRSNIIARNNLLTDDMTAWMESIMVNTAAEGFSRNLIG